MCSLIMRKTLNLEPVTVFPASLRSHRPNQGACLNSETVTSVSIETIRPPPPRGEPPWSSRLPSVCIARGSTLDAVTRGTDVDGRGAEVQPPPAVSWSRNSYWLNCCCRQCCHADAALQIDAARAVLVNIGVQASLPAAAITSPPRSSKLHGCYEEPGARSWPPKLAFKTAHHCLRRT